MLAGNVGVVFCIDEVNIVLLTRTSYFSDSHEICCSAFGHPGVCEGPIENASEGGILASVLRTDMRHQFCVSL